MSVETQDLYDFGEFRLDVTEKVLLRDGKSVPLTPKYFETLQVLVEHAGHLLGKDELMQRLWKDQFVEESNLTFNIGMIRKALGDDAADPKFIETVPKRGYRFIADVRRSEKIAENLREGQREKEPISTSTDSRPPLLLVSPSAQLPPVPSPQWVQPSGLVVALADWRHEAGENNAGESVSDFVPERSEARNAKLELVPETLFIQNKRTSYLVVLAGLIGLVLAGFGYGLYHLVNRSAQSNAFRMSNLTRLTSNGKTKLAAAAPNGEFIAYILDDEGQQSLWLKNIATGSDTQILSPAEDTSLQGVIFAPDGNYIYHTANGSLYRLPLLGGLPKKIIQDLGVRSDFSLITFSPDGKQFAFIRHLSESESDIVVADADGANERVLASSKRPEHFLRSAAWSPDGKVIAVITQTVDGRNKIVTVRISDGIISSVPSPSWSLISQIAWQRDGDSLLAVATEGRSSISRQIWSLLYPSGEAQNITNDLNSYQNISLTRDGRVLVAVRVEQVAHIWALQGEESSQARQLTHGIDRYDGIWGLNYLSGGKIIYESTPSGKGEVWTMDADGRSVKQLAGESGSTAASPDGKHLVFQSKDADGVGLFRLDLSSGEKKRLTQGADVWSTFSPDGKWVVFTRWAEQIALWKVSIDGGEAAKLASVPGYATAPAVSPDAKFIAFHWGKSDPKQPSEIAIIPFDGGKIVKTFKLPVQHWQGARKNALQWTPDGQAVNYSVLGDSVGNIWRQPLDGGAPVQVTNFESGQIFNFSYSPDGKQLALSRGTFSRDVILIK